MSFGRILFKFFLIIFFNFSSRHTNFNVEIGEKLFNQNCSACHMKGSNKIIPEKNLKKETLLANGMYNFEAIVYQITNGKNGMPAFGGRLNSMEINSIANYLLEKSENNFQN